MEEPKSLRVEVFSKETIKPSCPSPTPDPQGMFKLSLLDQLTIDYYVDTLLFYKATTSPPGGVDERSRILKSSLSETLTHFYPFSGRLQDHLSLSCNGAGVEYSEARVLSHSLFDILQKPNPHDLNVFHPETSLDHITARPLILVRVSFFECGGMALAFKVCHKVADAATIATFVNGWAGTALGNSSLVKPDLFTASALFPPTDSLPSTNRFSQVVDRPRVRASRFVFGPSELAALQALASRKGFPRPTRFEAVSAFLWKSAYAAKKAESGAVGCPKSSALLWSVNLRSRLQPPIPAHSFGNLGGLAVHEDDIDAKDLPGVVDLLRMGMKDVCNDYIHILKEGGDILKGVSEMRSKAGKLLAKAGLGTTELYILTSWCKFPLYEADFGWGKPVYATAGGSLQTPNLIMLMDTRDGRGIEAWVSMTEEIATRLESNEDLQKYASLNPSAYD